MDHVGNLNQLCAEEDINTLAAVRALNQERMMVAEAMLRLNQINLYSLDSDSSKTLCVGDELTDVMEVDSRLKINRHKYYGYIVPGKDYFVALYNNVSYKAYFEGVGESQLQFFSWDGQPLLCVNLPYMVTSFSFWRINTCMFSPTEVRRKSCTNMIAGTFCPRCNRLQPESFLLVL